MADPFSIVAGVVGLTDVCLRTIKLIKDAREGFRELDSDLDSLNSELGSLQAANKTIREAYDSIEKANVLSAEERKTHWEAVTIALKGCESITKKIETLLKQIVSGKEGNHGTRDQFRKWLKLEAKENVFLELRQKLSTQQNALQLILQSSVILIARSSQQTSNEKVSSLARNIDTLGETLKAKIDSLNKDYLATTDATLTAAINAARKVADNIYVNEHFFVPCSVASSFTGREHEFQVLQQHMLCGTPNERDIVQKRFVLYGLAGSGKTQTCCKFALNHKTRYWGVFWLNASSKEHLKQSFISLAEIPRVSPTEAAVKGWLSSLGSNRPWLLIIDNADDPNVLVEQNFPDNIHGSILITTRNHTLRTQGTVGPRYLELAGLDSSTAVSLLLRLADEIIPWTREAKKQARKIAEKVGYLPLALTYAGGAIASRLCSLQTYLDFYDRCWIRLRKYKGEQKESSVLDTDVVIYSTYELIYQSLLAKGTQASHDASDLLKIFSFLDRQNIKLKIFVRAANYAQAPPAANQTQSDSRGEPSPKQSWSMFLRNTMIEIIQRIQQLGTRSVLPGFLSTDNGEIRFDEFRLRGAVNELLKLSLISMSSTDEDTYTMHPAVHTWARQRPEMTLGNQAIWCQVTSTILADAILLPPHDDTAEGEAFLRGLLPHVIHVRTLEAAIEQTFKQNRVRRRKLFPILPPPVTPAHLVRLVKYSLVYYQGYRMTDAEELQVFVLTYLKKYIGTENPRTIGLLRLLSRTYFQLARMDDAVELQAQAYQASLVVFGQRHPETLQVMDQYASALWLQGQFRSSRAMHEKAVEILTETLGTENAITLKAMIGLGRALSKDFAFDEAIRINILAYDGLRRIYDVSHSATLEAMDTLAMSYFDRTAYRQGQKGDLIRALALEEQVYSTRLESLGQEHYHTLWAGLNLARIRAVRGETEEALAIFLPGRAVVIRDLEAGHFLRMFTELHYARILMCAGEYQQANAILEELYTIHKKTGRTHPDRLLVLFSLIKCHRVLEFTNHTDQLFQELVDGTKATFGDDHPAVATILDENALSATTSDVHEL